MSEQQKNDAKLTHDKSELEQIKQDIANANRQKQSDAKALEKKVTSDCLLYSLLLPPLF